MEKRFNPGDFLFFQLEAGFAIIRVIGIDLMDGDVIWHIVAYDDLFPDIDSIESAIENPELLSIAIPQIALTNRAFESTQVAEIGNVPVSDIESEILSKWRNDPDRPVSDRSIRLHLGLR